MMSSPTLAPKPNSCAITIEIFDGSRQPLGGAQQVLFTVRDGNQNQGVLNEVLTRLIVMEHVK